MFYDERSEVALEDDPTYELGHATIKMSPITKRIVASTKNPSRVLLQSKN